MAKDKTLSRRTFLGLSAAAGLAAALSSGDRIGLEPKTAEALAAENSDEVKRIRSTCRACGKMECGIWVTVRNNRVIKIEGDDSAYTSRGNCCAKSRSAMQTLYHPDRIKYPMKRTNPDRGKAAEWVRISWEEAIDICAKGLLNIIADPECNGAHSIKILHGTSRHTTYATESLPFVMGTANWGATAGQVCKGPRVGGNALIAYPCHWMSVTDGAKVIINWGTNPEMSNYDTAGRVLIDEKFKAEKTICVGPRKQNLGKEMDIQLHLRPGSDAGLAQGLINYIVQHKMYDELFVKRWTDAPFLYCDDIEATGFDWAVKYESGYYPVEIKTKLVKESDLVEGGNPKKFAVWNSAQNCITFFDSEKRLWDGEDVYLTPQERKDRGEDVKIYNVKDGIFAEDPGFPPELNLDPAIEGEYDITLKDGTVVKAKPSFELFKNRVSYWTPKRTAEYCWLREEDIIETAEIYGKEPGQGGILYNLALEHSGNAIQTVNTVLMLSALMNNVDTPGGNRGSENMYYLYNTYMEYHAPLSSVHMEAEDARQVAGYSDPDGKNLFPLLPWISHIGGAALVHDQTAAADMIRTGKPYPIKGMISCTGNHFHSSNADDNWDAFKQLKFYMGWELVFAPTIELADVVLPATHFLETSCVRISKGAENGIGAQVACVEPMGECAWDSASLVSLLAKRMSEVAATMPELLDNEKIKPYYKSFPWWPGEEQIDLGQAPPWFPRKWAKEVDRWPDAKHMLDFQVIPLTPNTEYEPAPGVHPFASGFSEGGPNVKSEGDWEDNDVVNEYRFSNQLGLEKDANGMTHLVVNGWDDFVQKYQEGGQWHLKDISPFGYYKRYMWKLIYKDTDPTAASGANPIGVGEGDWNNGFPTPTGKFELWSTMLESYPATESAGGTSRSVGYEETDNAYGDALSLVREPYASPYSTPELYKEYPVVVTTGRRNPLYFHSEQRQQPYTREIYPVPHFQINSELANSLGIENGDWCWLETPHGKIRQVADVFDGIDPRVIECDHAWWFPELPAPTHGYNLCNINCLVDKYSRDPIIGSTSLRAYLAKVYKATPENCPFGHVIPCSDEVDNDLPDGVPYAVDENGDKHPQIIVEATDPHMLAWMPMSAEQVDAINGDVDATDYFERCKPNYGREFL